MTTKSLPVRRADRKPGARRALPPLALFPGLLAVCYFLGIPTQAVASLTAPDNVIYGLAAMGTNEITASQTEFAIEARRTNGLVVARYRMGDQTDIGNFYQLSIPVEETAPAVSPCSLMLAEPFILVLTSNSIPLATKALAIVERGSIQRLDFGALAVTPLSGYELWALVHGLNLSSQADDSDGDGISNLQEFIAGTSPTNASSLFLLRIAQTNQLAAISFDALQTTGSGYDGVARHYSLEQRSTLASGTWQPVTGYQDLIGANQVVTYHPSANTKTCFYRGAIWLSFASNSATLISPADFSLSITPQAANRATISFNTQVSDTSGRACYYTLESTTNLPSGAWNAVAGLSNIAGTGQPLTWTSTPPVVSARFFRVRLELRNQ
jgi:hypothetical protein